MNIVKWLLKNNGYFQRAPKNFLYFLLQNPHVKIFEEFSQGNLIILQT